MVEAFAIDVVVADVVAVVFGDVAAVAKDGLLRRKSFATTTAARQGLPWVTLQRELGHN
jgi:hypothetical protein